MENKEKKINNEMNTVLEEVTNIIIKKNNEEKDFLLEDIYNRNITPIFMKKPKQPIINFINNGEKVKLLQNANDILNITKSPLNKIIFVYSQPKVGSTSLVTSIRMFASHLYNVIHIHDEEMLKRLGNITNITVNEIIFYNKFIGKEVYVIDVYRSPIERKISAFFEKIDTYHFNNNVNNINNYSIERIINRFNKLYPYIGNGDHFIDLYPIDIPNTFDKINKYILLQQNGINYIKLRLKDSSLWSDILTTLLNVPIKIIKDYETTNKIISKTYIKFKENYKIPINYLEELDSCLYLNYYYTEQEKEEYFHDWSNKVGSFSQPFSPEEFKIYEYITQANQYKEYIQSNHYLDEGCICKACYMKRMNIANKVLKGESKIQPIIHEEAKHEFITNRIEYFKKLKVYLEKTKEVKKINNISMNIL